ncbi:MAG: STAS domain-containing protein [Solirubrobacteraceae bacterium]
MTGVPVNHRSFEGCVLIDLPGDLDFASVDDVTQTLEEILGEASSPIVIDLSQTTFLDSAGISLLYELRNSLRMRDQALRLVIPEITIIRRALVLSGAADSFRIFGSVAEACAGVEQALEPPA